MNETAIKKIYDHLFPRAKTLVEQDKMQHAPMLFTFKVEGDRVAALGMAVLVGHKEGTGIAIKLASKNCPSDCVCVFVDEVWMNYPKNGKVDNETPVKDQPGSFEAVVFNFFGKDWEALAPCKINRNPTLLEKGEIIVGGTSVGRMAPDVEQRTVN